MNLVSFILLPVVFASFFFKKSVRRSLFQPRRPRGSQSGREKGRDESFQVRAKEPNTKDYFSWEPEKINVKFYKNCENRGNILNISYVRSHFGKFDICFLGLPREIVFAVITDNRSKKKKAILFKLFWYKIFVH